MAMITNGKTITVTVQEGHSLLTIAAAFGLPEKLGTDQSYSVADRSIAGDEVRKLYRELRARSELMQKPERWQRFGPAIAWKEIIGENGQPGHRLASPALEVTISVDDDIISGIVWCLILALHPASQLLHPISSQEEVLWPLAARISRTKVIRENVGMAPGKAQPKRWKSDEEMDEKAKAEEKSEAKDPKEAK